MWNSRWSKWIKCHQSVNQFLSNSYCFGSGDDGVFLIIHVNVHRYSVVFKECVLKRHKDVRSVSRQKKSLAGDPERPAVYTVSAIVLVTCDQLTCLEDSSLAVASPLLLMLLPERRHDVLMTCLPACNCFCFSFFCFFVCWLHSHHCNTPLSFISSDLTDKTKQIL